VQNSLVSAINNGLGGCIVAGAGTDGTGAEAYGGNSDGNGRGGAGGYFIGGNGLTNGNGSANQSAGAGTAGYGGYGNGGTGGYFVGGSAWAVTDYPGDGVDAYGGSGKSNGISETLGGVGIYAAGGANPGGGSNLAGFFSGDVRIFGNLTKGGGSFQIDHPLDPANKYLYHSFVESPDMKNIYDGTVVTDGGGAAVVTLPDWFETLNRDFRYQLTVIGQFAQAIIANKIGNHQFTIKTDKPAVEVSWQVTGIRQDPWANAHRIPVEEDKPEKVRGHYLYPELYGQPETQSVLAAERPDLMRRMEAPRP
jgi:hypothetical protein